MTLEEDIIELKTNMKWVMHALDDMKKKRDMHLSYTIGIVSSLIIAMTSIIISIK